MAIKDKIEWINKYCGRYHAHFGMIDERIGQVDFNIETCEEKSIRECLGHCRVIILTGEAGDGKSRILNNLRQELSKNGFLITDDFSAETNVEKEKIIDSIYHILTEKDQEKDQEKRIIAANIGILTKAILIHKREVLKLLTGHRELVKIVNFEKRNLAADKEWFEHAVRQFLAYDGMRCEYGTCPHAGNCVFQDNIEALARGPQIEAMRTLCNAVFLTGGHITFRELLSFLAFGVTFGMDCTQAGKCSQEEMRRYCYFQLFQENDDVLLEKFAAFDPAKKRNMEVQENPYIGIEDYFRRRRKAFFDGGGKYELLYADYIDEFHEALLHFSNRNYIALDSEIPVFMKIKEGISKLSADNSTDRGVMIKDTPAIFGKEIQTEFKLDLATMDLIWRRTDLDMEKLQEEAQTPYLDNRFYLSLVYEEKEQIKIIDMPVDYPVFQYLMAVGEGYYMGQSNSSVEEYTVNTFYRKILKTQEEAYRKMLIRFEGAELCDLEMELYQTGRLLGGQTKIRLTKV